MKMSRSSRKIVASKASIHADGFTKESKIRQTTAHHAFHTTAKGDVKICIEQQYPKQESDMERPPAGSIIKGDSAEISSRTMHGPYLSKIFKGQKVKHAEGNVQAVVHSSDDRDGGGKILGKFRRRP